MGYRAPSAPSRRKSAGWRLVALVAGIAAAGSALLAGRLLVVSRPVADPDAIVSLASHEWERLPLVADLARRHPRAAVVLTLPPQPTRFNCHECEHRADRLVDAGVSADRIHIVPLTTGGTYGEALGCRQLVTQMPFKRLLIVTSPYHTRRSLAVFHKLFADTDVHIGIAPALAFSPARPGWWWLSRYDLWYVNYEWAATLYYGVRHGVTVFG